MSLHILYFLNCVCYLVIGALVALQLGQAGAAHSVTTPEADGATLSTVKLMAADGTRQEFGPLGGLDRHVPRLMLQPPGRPRLTCGAVLYRGSDQSGARAGAVRQVVQESEGKS